MMGSTKRNAKLMIRLLAMDKRIAALIGFFGCELCAMTLDKALGIPICAKVIMNTMVGDARV